MNHTALDLLREIGTRLRTHVLYGPLKPRCGRHWWRLRGESFAQAMARKVGK